MTKIHPGRADAHAEEHTDVNSKQLPHGIKFDNRRRRNSRRRPYVSSTFDDLFADGSPRNVPVVVSIQSTACSRGARDSLQFLCVVVVLSTLSFGFIASFLGIFVRAGQGYASGSDVDIAYWTACATNSSVTKLGQELPYNTVRARVSLPKFYEVVIISTVIAYLFTQAYSAVCQVATLSCCLAAMATPLYLHPSSIGSDSLPKYVDPVISMSFVFVMLGGITWNGIRAKDSTKGFVSRYPRVVFNLCLVAIFTLNSVMCNLSPPTATGMIPGSGISIGYIIARGAGLVMRLCMKGIDVPLLGSWSIFFVYDVSIATTLRRYMLGLIDGDDATVAILATAMVELFLNGISVRLAVYTFNKKFPQSQDVAMLHMNVFLGSIVSDMLSEQIALHSCLSYAVFADPRIFSIGEIRSAEVIVRNWVTSFIVELIVDGVCIWSIVMMLPISLNGLVTRIRTSTIMLIFSLCATVHPHLIGLHSLVDQNRYVCDTNAGA